MQVQVSLYASEPSEGILTLLVDGDEVSSEPLVMPGGSQTVSIVVPGPLAPGWHTVVARIEAAGLTSTWQHDFAYATGAADLTPSRIELVAGEGPTRTVRLRIDNLGQEQSPATTSLIWDGDPDAGGTLLGTLPVPSLSGGDSFHTEMTWDVLGQAGVHTVTVVVDPDDVVAEFHEANNAATGYVYVPALDLALEVGDDSYPVGQTVDIKATLHNLSGASRAVTLTVSAMLAPGDEVFTDELALTLPPGGPASETVVWDTTGAPEGAYSIIAVAAGEDGEYAWAAADVLLEESALPPQVDAGPDLTGDEGSEIAFSATVEDSDTPEDHQVAWDFGDGTVATGTLTPTHIYGDDGEYTVTLTVTDTTGLAGTDGLSATIANVAPVVDAGADVRVDLGEEVLFSGSFSDPGIADTHTTIWDFGDGHVGGGTLAPAHTYSEAGVYTATLTIEDDDGGVGSDVVQVVVRPVLQALEVRHAVIHWWSRDGSQLHLMLRGELELPDGYEEEDLAGDVAVRLTIAGQTVSETVSLRRFGSVWHYQRRWHDGQLLLVQIIWQRWGDRGSAKVLISGVFSMDGVSVWTRPAEVELELRLFMKSEPELEWVSGKVAVEFKAYGRVWRYRAHHRVWPYVRRRFWSIPTPWSRWTRP